MSNRVVKQSLTTEHVSKLYKLDAAFLRECANYFRNRPTGGEDARHWANVYNAENCDRIAAFFEDQ